MDDLDHIEEREAVAGPARIAAFHRPPGPAATGQCLNCETPLAIYRWCCPECSDDWHKRENTLKSKYRK